MSKYYKVGVREFKTKADVKQHYQDMLRSYAPGEKLNQQDSYDLASLLRYHENKSEKIGCGIDYLKVDKAEFGTNCFYIVRKDSTHQNFSYMNPIKHIVKS